MLNSTGNGKLTVVAYAMCASGSESDRSGGGEQ